MVRRRLGRRVSARARAVASGGGWLNWIGDAGDARVRAAFGAENYERLQVIKSVYDPANVFHGNQNVPAPPA